VILLGTDPDDLDRKVDLQVQELNEAAREAFAVELAAGFITGLGNGKKEILNPSTAVGDHLTRAQRRAVEKLSAEYFGYISEFNEAAGEQLKKKAREIIEQGGPEQLLKEEVQKYAEDIWGGSETVVIDRVGQTRTVIDVTKDRTLRKIEKEITKAYKTNVTAYSDMLARTASHSAYEDGRAAAYQEEDLKQWRFIGPVDERSRPEHAAIVGEHFTYGTPESEMAQKLLHEPNCRHRATPYYDDPEFDTPQEEFEKQKAEMGLYWDETQDKWMFK
jgi:SPP1 gp7 family putative phage head morphogenesis protein